MYKTKYQDIRYDSPKFMSHNTREATRVNKRKQIPGHVGWGRREMNQKEMWMLTGQQDPIPSPAMLAANEDRRPS